MIFFVRNSFRELGRRSNVLSEPLDLDYFQLKITHLPERHILGRQMLLTSEAYFEGVYSATLPDTLITRWPREKFSQRDLARISP